MSICVRPRRPRGGGRAERGAWMRKSAGPKRKSAYQRLSFRFELLDGAAIAVTPCIDGTSLSDLAQAYEISRGYDDPAGGYGGLVPKYLDYGPLDEYFLARGESPGRQANGAQYLLGCQCGDVGCWPLMGRIIASKGAYEWRDFLNPCRDARDYKGLGPFRFEASAYVHAIGKLQESLAGR